MKHKLRSESRNIQFSNKLGRFQCYTFHMDKQLEDQQQIGELNNTLNQLYLTDMNRQPLQHQLSSVSAEQIFSRTQWIFCKCQWDSLLQAKATFIDLFQTNPSKLCIPAEILGNSTLKLPRGLLIWLISVRETLILFLRNGVVKMIFIYLLLFLIRG